MACATGSCNPAPSFKFVVELVELDPPVRTTALASLFSEVGIELARDPIACTFIKKSPVCPCESMSIGSGQTGGDRAVRRHAHWAEVKGIEVSSWH